MRKCGLTCVGLHEITAEYAKVRGITPKVVGGANTPTGGSGRAVSVAGKMNNPQQMMDAATATISARTTARGCSTPSQGRFEIALWCGPDNHRGWHNLLSNRWNRRHGWVQELRVNATSAKQISARVSAAHIRILAETFGAPLVIVAIVCARGGRVRNNAHCQCEHSEKPADDRDRARTPTR